jgi:hypothetical protein
MLFQNGAMAQIAPMPMKRLNPGQIPDGAKDVRRAA